MRLEALLLLALPFIKAVNFDTGNEKRQQKNFIQTFSSNGQKKVFYCGLQTMNF